MNVAQINDQLRALIAEHAATVGDGSILTEKRKKASDFVRAVAKRNGLKLSTDREAIERIAGHIRWHGAGAAARTKAKGKGKKGK